MDAIQVRTGANETKNQSMATLADELRAQLGAVEGALGRVD